MGVFEILSFLVPLILGHLKKKADAERSEKMLLLQQREDSRNNAFMRSEAEDTFTKWWRVPVRPIITYTAWFAFFSLPFIAMIAPVNMEVCEPQTGFWAWLFGQEEAICKYIVLSSGVTWTAVHTHVSLAISGYWFGNR